MMSRGNWWFKVFQRTMSTRFKARDGPKNLYHDLNFHSNTNLAKHLEENILYYEPENPKSFGLMVLNKPYGVPKMKQDVAEPSLEEALPILAERMKLKELEILKCAPRYTSGPLIINANGSLAHKNRVNKLRRVAKMQGYLQDKYLLVLCGSPTKPKYVDEDNLDRGVLRLEATEKRKTYKGTAALEAAIHRQPVTKTQLKRKRRVFKKFSNRLEVLTRSEGERATLVSMEPMMIHWNFLQVYAADSLLAPVLGDHMYSYRVKRIMNKKVRVGPSMSPKGNEVNHNLPPWMLHTLGLDKNSQALLPLHAHWYRVCIPNFFGDGEHLKVFADPPQYFLNTLDALSLNTDFKSLESNDRLTNVKKGATGP